MSQTTRLRLLFEENLSPKLVSQLERLYPDSSHVHELGLGAADDLVIWEFARGEGHVLVSKDSDFHSMSVHHGHPPKVVWIRRGNCRTEDVALLLRTHHELLLEFGDDSERSILILS